MSNEILPGYDAWKLASPDEIECTCGADDADECTCNEVDPFEPTWREETW